ncbi:methylated-DNA--[protein]-cysteine S-methyltransferase [Allobaculum sp. Allo2]|uniref:methylated-DNA--[protein]-cysteine S-methyltransferase n=1 Tax=Allobaculum sp. Allo2 TaxID=2853432 RepID=UPI003462F222
MAGSLLCGENPDFRPELSTQGTLFQQEVWAILKAIPLGETTTYGDIARTIAAKRGMSRMSAQAVGQAVGSNPISLMIPCHRVLGSNGLLTGYAGGVDRKRALLEREKAEKSHPRTMKTPKKNNCFKPIQMELAFKLPKHSLDSNTGSFPL